MHLERKLLAPLLLLVALSLGCAVTKQTCPNCTPETVWRLNTASELQQDERAYRTLFTDIGAAHRAGTLTDAQVADLNKGGDKLKLALETANQGFKAYLAGGATTRDQVIQLILAAENILFALTAQKSSVMIAKPRAELSIPLDQRGAIR